MRSGAAFAGALYIAVAIVMLYASDRRGAHWLWRCIGIALAMLGIARGFDFSFRFAAMLRDFADSRGLYGLRRPWQWDAMHALGLMLLAALMAVVLMRRSAPFILRIAVIGVTGLGAIAVVRLVSLHEADHWMTGHGLLGLPRVRTAELVFLLLCGWMAALQIVRSRRIRHG